MDIFQRVYGYPKAEEQLRILLENQQLAIKLQKENDELKRRLIHKTLP